MSLVSMSMSMSASMLLLWTCVCICLCALPPTTEGLLLAFPTSRTGTGTRTITKAVVVTGGGVCSCSCSFSFVPPQSRTTSTCGHVYGYKTTTTTIYNAKQGDDTDENDDDNDDNNNGAGAGSFPKRVSATNDDKDGLVPSSTISPPEDTSRTKDNGTGTDTATVLLATVAFVSFWPLLALLRATITTSPSDLIDGFDIDMFMALKGILDDSNSNMSTNTNSIDTATTIMELPPLSPAEQLVGAIFGPPPVTTPPPRY